MEEKLIDCSLFIQATWKLVSFKDAIHIKAVRTS